MSVRIPRSAGKAAKDLEKTRRAKKAKRVRSVARANSGAVATPAFWWVGGIGGHLSLLDQTLLPERVKYLRLREVEEVVGAIRRLAVRGAPAIGVAAGYGLVLGARRSRSRGRAGFLRDVERARAQLAASRPTAVNLFWALERMSRVAAGLRLPATGMSSAARQTALERLLEEARAIHRQDEELCRAIGEHGAKLLKNGWNVLTHCNAGALATGGMGTALAVVYRAVEQGKKLRVFADETRPLLQGARLTSWELHQARIDVTVICDSAAASVIGQGKIHCVVVGADRITLNGDFANKIGTYGLAVLAREHDVPFYVAAPTTTFDRDLPNGDGIPIEERSAQEVVGGFGRQTSPAGVSVYNPAFDVTPARFVTAFITEKGVIRPPFKRRIARLTRD